MRVVTVQKNLWPFGSSAPESRTKRSSATIGQAMKSAYAAGKKSPDTGLFHSWLSESGLADRSDTLIRRLQREYDRGFEDALSSTYSTELSAGDVRGFTYKRQHVVPTEGGWKIKGGRLDDGTVFDSPEDAKRFIESWNRANPNDWKKTFYLRKDMGGNYQLFVSRRGEPHQYFETLNAGFEGSGKEFWTRKGYHEIEQPKAENSERRNCKCGK